MADIRCTYKGSDSLNVHIGGLDTGWDNGRRTVYWHTCVAVSGKEPWEIPSTSWNYHNETYLQESKTETEQGHTTLSGLQPSTKYFIWAHVSADNNAAQKWDFYGEATTAAESTIADPQIKNFRAYQYADGVAQIQVGFRVVDAYGLWYKITVDGTARAQGKIDEEDIWNIFAVADFGEYEVYLQITETKSSSTVLVDASAYVTLYPPPDDKPSKWSWEASNGAASVTETISAYNAVTGKGAVTNFSAAVWNDLVAKTDAMLTAAGKSWQSTYLSYSSTLMTSDKKLTAKRYNSVLCNICYFSGISYTTRSRGNAVLGAYFTELTKLLNEAIDSL